MRSRMSTFSVLSIVLRVVAGTAGTCAAARATPPNESHSLAPNVTLSDYHDYEGAKRSLFQEVKHTYYDLYYLGRSLAVTEENVKLLIRLEEVVRARYRAAAASHPDMIKVQVELGKLEDRLKTLRDIEEPTKARLNAALNRPAGAPLTLPMDIAPPAVTLSEAALFARLDATHPSLLALHATARQHRLAGDLAQKDYRPDLTVGLSYVDVDKASFGATPPNNGQPWWHSCLALCRSGKNVPQTRDAACVTGGTNFGPL